MDTPYVTGSQTSTRWTRADLIQYIQVCGEMTPYIAEITNDEIEAMLLVLGEHYGFE